MDSNRTQATGRLMHRHAPWPRRRAGGGGATQAVVARGLSAMLLVLLLPACAIVQKIVQPPQLTLIDMRLAQAGLFEQVLEFDLELDNPNGFALPLAGMNYTLELAGVEIGQGQQSEPVTLPAFGQARWPVSFKVNSLRLIQSLLADADFSSLDYRIHGQFLVSKSAALPPIPFERRGTVGN